jgi:hypothetical protein
VEVERAESSAPASGQAPPTKPAPYTCIYRIWENFSVLPLIDRSVITVKADAARRAFLAEGRDIVWAVIDSGVDEMHEHFKDAGTLKLQLPLRHFATVSKAAGSHWWTSSIMARMWRALSPAVCSTEGHPERGPHRMVRSRTMRKTTKK